MNMTKLDEYRDTQAPLKTALECAKEDIEKALVVIEKGLQSLQTYIGRNSVQGEHLWCMMDNADTIRNARHDIECALIDIVNETE